MVVNKIKFICGEGCMRLHYCEYCGEPYDSEESARECEASHQTPEVSRERQLQPTTNFTNMNEMSVTIIFRN